MKPERQMLILFILLGVMVLCWYLHSLSYNNWQQAPTPKRFESRDQFMERVSQDSVQRIYIDSVDMKMKFRIEPINETSNQ